MPTTINGLWRLIGITAMAAMLGGCATSTTPETTTASEAGPQFADDDGSGDPLEGMNRRIFAFNEGVDEYALAPAANAWIAVTPAQLRRNVGNFFDNAGAPGQVLNNLLQAKGQAAATDAARFFVNTTIGLAGLFDVASGVGLETRPEDFGQTLGVWGLDSGPYLMLPLLGPSSTRDVSRYPVDWYTDVLTYLSLETATRAGLTGLNIVNTRAQLGRAISIRNEAALDPYAFTRSSYQQQRRSQVYDGEPPAGEDDPYGDFFDQQGSKPSPPNGD